MRRFILVTATRVEQGCSEVTSGGIRKLKRGISRAEFVSEYLKPFELTSTELLDRGDTTTAISRAPSAIMTWNFTEYPEDELLRAVSHLKREELLRDLKELLPLRVFP